MMRLFNFLFPLTLTLLAAVATKAQSPVQKIFPEGTVTYGNIPYANDTVKKHLLDIYLPPHAGKNLPLVVWIHGGAWMTNDKYADMSYMQQTIKEFIDSGYALASIDYRFSTQAIFPAQAQDCNTAIEFLYQHADKYGFDKNRIALIGFSAGGHLASLIGLSNNNNVREFFPLGVKGHFRIRCVLDFYGPSDLIAMASAVPDLQTNSNNPVATLLGAMPLVRPDLAVKASPVTYIDKDDPPFFIVQGEKDESVPNFLSKLLSNWLSLSDVKNQLIIVPGAPHFGVMFDAENIRQQLFRFLSARMK